MLGAVPAPDRVVADLWRDDCSPSMRSSDDADVDGATILSTAPLKPLYWTSGLPSGGIVRANNSCG